MPQKSSSRSKRPVADSQSKPRAASAKSRSQPHASSAALAPVHGEPSFSLASKDVRLSLTRRGGHLAPVLFRLPGSGNVPAVADPASAAGSVLSAAGTFSADTALTAGRPAVPASRSAAPARSAARKARWASPFSLAPWKPSDLPKGTPPVLQILRGDFLCFPFGGNPGVAHVHGDPANAPWKLKRRSEDQLVLGLDLKSPKGRMEKVISIRPGHRAVYQEHLLSGFSGRFNFGNHAILHIPEDEGEARISVSPFRFGAVKPDAFPDPRFGEYGALKTGAVFKDLAKVPLATGGHTDLSVYPAREGFEDLIMVSSRPADFAWTAVTFRDYVWISLKDPRVLPSTLFWISNGGRHQAPWSGRHRRRIGLEEVCSYFCDGLDLSEKDLLKGKGIATTRLFRPEETVSIRLVQVVHPVPPGFGRVTRVIRSPDLPEIEVMGEGNLRVTVPVDHGFLG